MTSFHRFRIKSNELNYQNWKLFLFLLFFFSWYLLVCDLITDLYLKYIHQLTRFHRLRSIIDADSLPSLELIRRKNQEEEEEEEEQQQQQHERERKSLQRRRALLNALAAMALPLGWFAPLTCFIAVDLADATSSTSHSARWMFFTSYPANLLDVRRCRQPVAASFLASLSRQLSSTCFQ